MTDPVLLQKYNIPAPRYTSYPTVPYWQEEIPEETTWLDKVWHAFAQDMEISLYLHLPYCERLCTYCGCNKRITLNHDVELPYIETLLKEWNIYLRQFPQKPILREVHLGGGTPTFFHPRNLELLLRGILQTAEIPEKHEFSFEAHPNSTTPEHLQTLYQLGFRRISIGVQDVAPEIMEIINRQQSVEEVRQVTAWARDTGYSSINFDLIYGLPLQTKDHIRRTMEEVRLLRPERIALYSYAHVPWVKPSQRAYSEADLPLGQEKRELYELGRNLLEEMGYVEIGMDHFALPGDPLYEAWETGALHRNFMGYTPYYTRLSIGLGASAISDSWDAFVQNEKTIEAYREAIETGHLALSKGHLLTAEDQAVRTHILNLMCRFETSWEIPGSQCQAIKEGLKRMEPLIADGLAELFPCRLRVTEKGRPFLRILCMALDARYWQKQPSGALFSQNV